MELRTYPLSDSGIAALSAPRGLGRTRRAFDAACGTVGTRYPELTGGFVVEYASFATCLASLLSGGYLGANLIIACVRSAPFTYRPLRAWPVHPRFSKR